ncbi:MAG: hypothetical protein Ta2F_12830 [Termitinemataceae bacterium]|nr:MAG: hypothetical protein Ta2F_12830 [Termitinemataceae bacterium]
MKKQTLRVVGVLVLTAMVFAGCKAAHGSNTLENGHGGKTVGTDVSGITVTFDANGGRWPELSSITAHISNVGINGKVKQLPNANPVLDGHNFLGWFTQKLEPINTTDKPPEGSFTTKTTVLTSTTVYALYKEKTVEVDEHGDQHEAGSVTFIQCSGGDIVGEPVEVLWSNEFRINAADIPNCGEREHYNQTSEQLNKWWLDVYSTISGELISEGELFTASHSITRKDSEDSDSEDSEDSEDSIVADDIVVYARWTGDIYTVTFDPQGGTFIDETGKPLSEQFFSTQIQYPDTLASETYPLVTKAADENGAWTLDGWYDIGKDTIKENDVVFDGVVNRNMTVYANWISESGGGAYTGKGGSDAEYTGKGGDVSIIEEDGAHYELHVFNTVGSHLYFPPADMATTPFSVLVVAGGGGGGRADPRGKNPYQAGGGGAGGLIIKYDYKLTSAVPVVVTVGAGGVGGVSGDVSKIDGKDGSNSSFGNLIAIGGGGGGGHTGGVSRSGHAGGSGGGIGGGWGTPGEPIRSDPDDPDYKGNRGGKTIGGDAKNIATGGGGAGYSGGDSSGGCTGGGRGLTIAITGSPVEYAIGGATMNNPVNSRDNSGNGGAGGINGTDGRPGNTGVVIIRFARPDLDVIEEVEAKE